MMTKEFFRFISLFFFFSQIVLAHNELPLNMAYIEVNDHPISIAGCYIKKNTNKPFFDMVAIFAANINGDNPNDPLIYFNPQVDAILNNTSEVLQLQNKGIKVLLTLLGNHQNAGWSCMTDQQAINRFANDVVKLANQYHLDGIDIDDEYSTCASNSTSMLRIAKAIKENSAFKNKLLTKALYLDHAFFTASVDGHKLAEYLDFGWEMSYGLLNFDARLFRYLNYGMQKENIYLGTEINNNYKTANAAASYVTQKNFGGMMTYNLKEDSQHYLNVLAQAEANTNVIISPDCNFIF
jgi:GH18 family chitinase